MSQVPSRFLARFPLLPGSTVLGSDSDLLAEYVRSRADAAFTALVARHGPMVLRVCRRLLGDVHAAEDAFQATFLVLARKADGIGQPDALAGWLHGVARRTSLKARARKNLSFSDRERLEQQEGSPNADPLAQVSAREALTILDEEVGRLPTNFRLPVLLCALEGLSQEEAARRLGWTVGSVKGRLERGRRRLHERLARRGLTLSAALASAECVRAATPGLSGLLPQTVGLMTSLPAPETPKLLAEAVLREMAVPRRALMALVFLAAGLAVGSGFLAAVSQPPETPQPVIEAIMPLQTPPVDRFGDPLPEGAIARLGTLRLRGCRGSLVFSPDGTMLASATASAGHEITLWDPTTGRALRRLSGGMPTIRSLAFSPDGKAIAAAVNALDAFVWDTSTGKLRFQPRGGHVAFSSDGTQVVTAESYGQAPHIFVWDATTGAEIRRLPLRKGAQHFALADKASVLAVIDQDDPSTVEIRHLGKETTMGKISVGQEARHLSISPDGKTVATSGHEGVILWDVATGKNLRSWGQRADSRVVFPADGSRLAWVGYNGVARLWTVEREGATPRSLGEPTNHFVDPCFSPDGKTLATLTDAGAISLRDAATGRDLLPMDAHQFQVYQLAVSADGSTVVSGDRAGGCVWEVASGRLVRRFPGYEAVGERTLAFLAEGRLLTGDFEKRIYRVREARTGKEILQFEGRFDVGAGGEPAVSANGRYFTSRDLSGRANVHDALTGQRLYSFEFDGSFFAPHISSDGRILSGFSGPPRQAAPCVRDPESGKIRLFAPIKEEEDLQQGFHLRIYQQSISPDGRWLAYCGSDGTLHCIDLTTGKARTPLGSVQSQVWELTWSPDGRYLATRGNSAPPGVKDRDAPVSLRVWDIVAGQQLPLLDPPPPVAQTLFSPDSRTLLTTDFRGEITLWEVTTGKKRRVYGGHLNAGVSALALSADGRTLVSAGADSQILVWDLRK